MLKQEARKPGMDPEIRAVKIFGFLASELTIRLNSEARKPRGLRRVEGLTVSAQMLKQETRKPGERLQSGTGEIYGFLASELNNPVEFGSQEAKRAAPC
jgi:hypothetical protein